MADVEVVTPVHLEDRDSFDIAPTRVLSLPARLARFRLGVWLAVGWLGLLVAWVVERTDAPGRELFHALSLMSFAIPGLLTTMAWMLTLSPNIGWLNAIIKDTLGPAYVVNIYTMGGMIWALSSHYFPLAYLLLAPSMRALDLRMEEAAAMSGARSWQTLTRVLFPLTRAGMLAGSLLCFGWNMGVYIVPILLGTTDDQRVLAVSMYVRAVRQNDYGMAAAQGIVLMILASIVTYVSLRYSRGALAS